MFGFVTTGELDIRFINGRMEIGVLGWE